MVQGSRGQGQSLRRGRKVLRKVLEVGWRSDPGIRKVRRGTRGYILGFPSPQLSLPRKLGS